MQHNIIFQPKWIHPRWVFFLIKLLFVFPLCGGAQQSVLVGSTQYGTPSGGGQFGTIYAITPGANLLNQQHVLTGTDGSWPNDSKLTQVGSKLYGVTGAGGAHGGGIIFEYDYSTMSYTKKIDMDYTIASGCYSSMLLAPNGKLYGTTAYGGINGDGTIFEYDPAANTYVRKIDFTHLGGALPFGAMVLASNGKMYGLCYEGGATNRGAIYEYDYITNTYTKKIDLTSANGEAPNGHLVHASNNKLYGMTRYGGDYSLGVIFEYDYTSNTYTKKVDFSSSLGGEPLSSLTQASNGHLYGMTHIGGTNDLGVLFEYNIGISTYTVKKHLSSSEGSYPNTNNLTEAVIGKLYGTTPYGGSNSTGVLFEFNTTTNVYSVMYNFISTTGSEPEGSIVQAGNGKFYGTTGSGGNGGLGTLYEFNLTGNVHTPIVYFNESDGSSLRMASIVASNKKLYGVATSGGIYNNAGVIYEYDYFTDTYTKKIDLDYSTTGSGSWNELMEAPNGKIYGLMEVGGSTTGGTLFEYDYVNNIFTKKHDFSNATGRNSQGGLTLANNGKLYGTTRLGGSNAAGVIFEYDYVNNTYTVKHHFNYTQGAYPSGTMVMGDNGKLYGLTPTGGSNYSGVLFEYDYMTNIYTVKLEIDYNQGYTNSGSLIKASNGKLYALGTQGGAYGNGTIFEYDITSNTITVKHHFPSSNILGSRPGGNIRQSLTNGFFYGIAHQGGANNQGTLFEYDLVNNIYTKKLDFGGSNGAHLSYGALAELALQYVYTGNITNLSHCAGDTVHVAYTKFGSFVNSNSFVAQLSDSLGSFASPQNIGSIVDTVNGTIVATIPVNTPSGIHYRIRVAATNPATNGTNNGADITVNAQPVCQNGGIVNSNCGCDCLNGFSGVYCENASCIPNTGSTTVAACDAYIWMENNNSTYSASGSYTHTFTNVGGCDSVHTLNLTITPSTNNTTTASACDIYTWSVNGQSYSSSGTYTSVSGCATETLILTITSSTNNTTTASACDIYTWSVNGQSYSSSGTYTSVSGCATETLILTITSSTNNTTTASACDIYTWSVNGQSYSSSGTYTSVSGCATETLILTITSSTNNTTTASACDIYTWSVNGQSYSSSGTYTSVSGCATETLILTITSSTNNTTTASACDIYTWSVNGQSYSSSGTYTSVSGCATETLILTITSSTNNTSSASACDIYTWSVNGQSYSSSGTYTSVSGCATETLILTITSSTNNTSSASACDIYTWSVNGQSYSSSGTYTSVSGCATETLILTITSSTNNTSSASACDIYTWSVNGQSYSSSGTYTSVSGCATETLILTITPSTNNTTSASACDTYTWSVNGQSYSSSGTYTSASGCATETLILTITPSTNNSTSASACDTYTWSVNGQTYSSSGTYTSVNGCATETLILTITPSTNNTTSASACDSYTWSVNGQSYSSSGTYTSVSGCATETLILTITPSTNNSTSASACDSYTWSVNGQSYSSSGTYTSVSGCATETLILTITSSTTITTSTAACGSYTWSVNGITYTASGDYTELNGCQTDVLHLTIYAIPLVSAPSLSSCSGNAIFLGGSPSGGSWDLPNPYMGNANQYTYYYTDINGCTNSAIASISINTAQVSITTVGNITGYSASIFYNAVAGIGWYELRWKPTSSSTWIVGTNSNFTTKNIINLIPNTTYEVQVRGFCSTTSPAGPWSSSYVFSTNNFCGTPNNLFVNNISATTAKLNWDAISGAQYYTVRWKKVNDIVWSTGTASSNTKTIAALSPASNYEFQVKTNCSNSSPYSASNYFSTLSSKLGLGMQAPVWDTTQSFSVYPNPSQEIVFIAFESAEQEEITIQVMDINGRVVQRIMTTANKELNTVGLNLSTLSNGVYMVQLQKQNGVFFSRKITKH